jgi:hypothetical protein
MKEIRKLTALGNKPLQIHEIVKGIDDVLDTPSAAGINTQRALVALKRHLKGLADENGVIPAESLYAVRKNAGDFAAIALRGSKSDRASTFATTKEVKQLLDNALESASGGGWRDYLETYAQMSHVIDGMKFMEGVRRTLVPAANDVISGPAVANLPQNLKATSKLLGDTSKLAKKVNAGVPTEAGKILSEAQVDTLAQVNRSIADQLKYQDLAKTGRKRMAESLDRPDLQIKNLLSRPVTVANMVLRKLGANIGEKTVLELQRLMLDPQVAAQAMQKATTKQQAIMLKSGILDAYVKSTAAQTAD